jgi:hypothetical protein
MNDKQVMKIENKGGVHYVYQVDESLNETIEMFHLCDAAGHWYWQFVGFNVEMSMNVLLHGKSESFFCAMQDALGKWREYNETAH